MSKQKKISPDEISQIFGVKISEKDLIPKTEMQQHGMKQFSNLSALLKENNFKVRDEKESESDTAKKMDQHNSKQKKDSVVDTSGETFSEIYSRLESVSAVKKEFNPNKTDKGKNFNSKSSWDNASKMVQPEETDDFSKYFKSSAMIVPDKDSEEPDK